MRLVYTLFLVIALTCFISQSDGWRRRRRWVRWAPVKKAFVRVGKVIVRAAKTVGHYVKKGIDILKHGCCGLHPSYCTNKKEYDKIRNEISYTSAAINRDWSYGEFYRWLCNAVLRLVQLSAFYFILHGFMVQIFLQVKRKYK